MTTKMNSGLSRPADALGVTESPAGATEVAAAGGLATGGEQRTQIPDRLYFRIGDVAEIVGVKPYVLRFWETEFKTVSPQKSHSGQRVYRRSDVEKLCLIRDLLYRQRYSIEGARKRLSELSRTKNALGQAKAEVVAPSAAERSQSTTGLSTADHKRAELLAHEIATLIQLRGPKLFSL